MRLFLLVVSFVFAFTFAPARVAAQAACEQRYSEPRVGVSFCAPAGWEMIEVESQPYTVLAGPRVGEFTPNMLLKAVEFPGTFDEYVKGNIADLERSARGGELQSYKFLGRTEFVTNGKARGNKIVVQHVVRGNLLRQTFYAFEAKDGRKIFFIYTVPAEGGEKYGPLFDESMKTLDFAAPAPPPPKPKPRPAR